MIPHYRRGRLRLFLGVVLLLTVGGCSPPTAPDVQSTPPGIPTLLSSPLMAFADSLEESGSDRNYLALLDIGSDALLTRIHLIRSARSSITIQTMIWVNDETGRYIVYELIQAARRGVRVRLLIDHLASEQDIEVAAFLANVHPNFQVKLFNPVAGFLGRTKAEPSLLDKFYAVFFSFNRLNQRMHNKTFVVDGRVGITGGRNYQNAYYDQARGMNYKDRDVLAVGPVVRSMQQSFERYWKFRRSVSLRDLVDVKRLDGPEQGRRWTGRASFQLNGLFEEIDGQANDPALISTRLVEPLLEVAQADFIADDPHKRNRSLFGDKDQGRITSALGEMIAQAQRSIYIQTPYLVLSSRAIRLFEQVREQHPEVDIRISTNSLAATDSWYVYALSYKQKKIYLSYLGFKIYEFKPLPGDIQTFMPSYPELNARAAHFAEQQVARQDTDRVLLADGLSPGGEDVTPAVMKTPYFCVHAKSLVVDGLTSFVGSYNLDPRSEKINTECGLIIRDARFARLLKRAIAKDMEAQNAWVIAPKKRFVGLDEANAMLVDLSHIIPLVDVWPFRYSASFELIEGRRAVEIDDPEFYDNYRDVGSFPQVKIEDSGKRLGAIGTKSFLGFVKPLL